MVLVLRTGPVDPVYPFSSGGDGRMETERILGHFLWDPLLGNNTVQVTVLTEGA